MREFHEEIEILNTETLTDWLAGGLATLPTVYGRHFHLRGGGGQTLHDAVRQYSLDIHRHATPREVFTVIRETGWHASSTHDRRETGIVSRLDLTAVGSIAAIPRQMIKAWVAFELAPIIADPADGAVRADMVCRPWVTLSIGMEARMVAAFEPTGQRDVFGRGGVKTSIVARLFY